MVSKKSVMFQAWLEGNSENKVELLVALEQAARLVVHDLDTMGEPGPKTLRALARASKKLQEEYGQG